MHVTNAYVSCIGENWWNRDTLILSVSLIVSYN